MCLRACLIGNAYSEREKGFERIIVPLDGSDRAESAIPVAGRIARATSSSIVLLQVVEWAPEYDLNPWLDHIVTKEEAEATITKATEYLSSVAQKEVLEGVGVQIEVLLGDAGPTNSSFAQSTTADLIGMCSHGYTGFKRWFLGSVADVVARTAPVPVLVLRDSGLLLTDNFQNNRPVSALITVDGSSLAEEALEPAAQLVAALASPAQGALHYILPFRLEPANIFASGTEQGGKTPSHC